MLTSTLNQPVTLAALMGTGQSDLFGRAYIYNSAGSLIGQVNIDHVADGLYTGQYTPTTEGYYSIVYKMFEDVSRTIVTNIGFFGETLEVSDTKTNIKKLLGLVHDNSVVDQQVYTTEGRLTSARIRNYDSKANADLAGTAGLLFTWTVLAQYSNGNCIFFKITQNP